MRERSDNRYYGVLFDELRRRGHVERLTVRLGREAGVVAEEVRRVGNVVLGFAQRFAAVQRVDSRELGPVFLDFVRHAHEQQESHQVHGLNEILLDFAVANLRRDAAGETRHAGKRSAEHREQVIRDHVDVGVAGDLRLPGGSRAHRQSGGSAVRHAGGGEN